jgi:hypothetical protein
MSKDEKMYDKQLLKYFTLDYLLNHDKSIRVYQNGQHINIPITFLFSSYTPTRKYYKQLLIAVGGVDL